MREIYFALNNIPYLYDLKAAKLYKLAGKARVEVASDQLIHRIRFHSIEITRSAALRMDEPECDPFAFA